MRNRVFLIFLTWLLSLLQFSVFNAWVVNGLHPQIWVALTFYLWRYRSRFLAEWGLFFFFLGYDLLTGAKPFFGLGLASILLVVLFRAVLSRYLEKRILAPLVFFLLLNLLGFYFLGGAFSFVRFGGQTLFNFVFYLLVYPLFFLSRLLLPPEDVPQLALKI